MDSKDFKLLVALHRDARQSLQSIGRGVGLTAPAVRARLDRLRESGVLPGYGLWVDPTVFGRGETLAFFKRERTRKDVISVLNSDDVAWVGWKLEGGLTVGIWAVDIEGSVSKLESRLNERSSGRAATASRVIRALTPVEWAIIDRLADDPHMAFGDLVSETGLSPKTVRNHLKRLVESETIVVMPRLGAMMGSGELVYQLSVAGPVTMVAIRRVQEDSILLHQTTIPEMKYLLCKNSNLAEVSTTTREIGKLEGVESVNLSLNRELFFSPKLIHRLVEENKRVSGW